MSLARSLRPRSSWIRIFCARKLVGFAICTFFFLLNGNPFSELSSIHHGATMRMSTIAELLRRNPSDLASGLPLSPTIIFTTNKRREKLRVESFLCTQVIMSRGGMIVPQEFLLKARSEQSISDALSFDIDL